MAFIFIDDGAHDASLPRTRDKTPSVCYKFKQFVAEAAKAIPSASSKEGCNPNTTVVTWPKEAVRLLSVDGKEDSFEPSGLRVATLLDTVGP
jgi:hypothetical protein